MKENRLAFGGQIACSGNRDDHATRELAARLEQASGARRWPRPAQLYGHDLLFILFSHLPAFLHSLLLSFGMKVVPLRLP